MSTGFAAWAAREGLLERITPDQCRDLAKAYMAGFGAGLRFDTSQLTI